MPLNLIITSASCTAVRMRTTSGSRAPAAARLISAPFRSGTTLSGGRAAAVVASPGGSARPVPLSRRRRCATAENNDQSPQSDLEYFLEEMKKFKESHPMTAKAISWNRLDAAYFANKCLELIEELLKKYNSCPLPADTLQEVCRIGRSFLELLVKYNSKSLRFDDIEMVIPGLIRIADIFPGELHLTEDVKDQPGLLPFGPRETYYRVKSKYPRIN